MEDGIGFGTAGRVLAQPGTIVPPLTWTLIIP